jgi:hypothetical protein
MMKQFGEAMLPFADAMDKLTDVIQKVISVGGRVGEAIPAMIQILKFMKDAQGMVGGVGDHGLFSDSAFETFNKATKPFSESMNSLSGILMKVSGMDSNADKGVTVLGKIKNMLAAAGGAVAAGFDENSMNNFKNALGRLGEGVELWNTRINKSNPTMMSGIAESLQRIADIKFTANFDPLLQLLNRTDDMNKAAMSLERMQKALQAPSADLSNMISGAITQATAALNGGTNANTNGAAGANGRNVNVDNAVLRMASLMEKWDRAQDTAPQEQQSSTNSGAPQIIPIPVFALANAQKTPFPASGSWNGKLG